MFIHFSSLYKQLTDEGPAENYEERRVNLLKSQVIQLERQVRVRKFKGGICCGSHLAITYGCELLYRRIFFVGKPAKQFC